MTDVLLNSTDPLRADGATGFETRVRKGRSEWQLKKCTHTRTHTPTHTHLEQILGIPDGSEQVVPERHLRLARAVHHRLQVLWELLREGHHARQQRVCAQTREGLKHEWVCAQTREGLKHRWVCANTRRVKTWESLRANMRRVQTQVSLRVNTRRVKT